MSYPVYMDVTESRDIEIPLREVKRYLGYGRVDMTPEVSGIAHELIDEMQTIMRPRACYTRLAVVFMDCPRIDFGFGVVESKDLWNNLSGGGSPCRECFIFAATVGPQVDVRIRKYARTSPSRSAILQAVGAAAIEAYCDLLEKRISAEAAKEGLSLLPRFSPGYGDFSLEHQRDFFRVLDPPRRAGITLTDQMLMVPEKSVTALIGLAGAGAGNACRQPGRAASKSGCSVCSNESCIYRVE